MSNLTHTQQAAIDQAEWQLEEACKLAANIGQKHNVGLGDGSSAARAVLAQTAAELIAYAWHEMVLTQTVFIDAPEDEAIPKRSESE
jgi:phosphoribosylformylglycinamidine (FGAM) synthase-like enzyme